MNASLEEAIELFETNWSAKSPPSIVQALKTIETSQRRQLAIEMAAIDMELRWRTFHQSQQPCDALGGQPTWRDYTTCAPEIGSIAELPTAMIAEEYRARIWWGDSPTHDQFLSLYPEHLTALIRLLNAFDDEAKVENPARFEQVVEESSSPIAFDPRAPLLWADYILLEFVGAGGFGKVYRAEQKSLDRTVAVKALHKSRQNDPSAVALFLQEARLLARLNHPGIVGVHGLGRYPGGGYFLVLDFVEGETVEQLRTQRAINQQQAFEIVLQTAKALEHAHECGVLHGDLKPANIMINKRGEVVVTDFGLGRLTSDCSPIASGGTRGFVAPEVAAGEPVSVAADIFGIGGLLESLCGVQNTFSSDEIWQIIGKCKAKEPRQRYSNVGEFIAEFTRHS